MKSFVLHFVRDSDGSWVCVRRGEFAAPDGIVSVLPGDRFRRGEVTKGMDFAAEFDAISRMGGETL